MSVTTDHVDYLQRRGVLPDSLDVVDLAGEPETRRLLRVRGVGRREKQRARHVPVDRRVPERWRSPTAELFAGLCVYRIPVAFAIAGTSAGVVVALGTWSARAATVPNVQDRRLGVVESLLRGLYPVVDLERAGNMSARWPLAGLALGVPAPAGIDETDGAAPIDRIIRSLHGSDWGALVLAYPVAESALAAGRSGVLNEIRDVQSAAQSEGAPSPLTRQYVELLEAELEHLADGIATGGWRTAVYLLGDQDSYPRLATAWRSVFSGEMSLPEPVRVFDRPDALEFARAWALPDAPAAPAPGRYERAFELQTLLTSVQLGSYIHLPDVETPGFQIDLVPRFDAVPAPQHGKGVAIGRILHQRRDTGSDYLVELRSLTRHVLVAGLTGPPVPMGGAVVQQRSPDLTRRFDTCRRLHVNDSNPPHRRHVYTKA